MLKIPYENLKSRFGRIAALNEAAAMLHWVTNWRPVPALRMNC